jgi:hypothetical protein
VTYDWHIYYRQTQQTFNNVINKFLKLPWQYWKAVQVTTLFLWYSTARSCRHKDYD